MADKPTAPMHTVVQDFLDQLRGAWRFRWSALWVAWLAALALWLGVFLIPETYEASARVFVDTGTTLRQATQGIGLSDNIDTQIQRVRQALLGGPQLQKVAEQTDLLAGALTPEERQDVIGRLRKDIKITGLNQGPAPGPQQQSAELFTITYRNHSRDRSLKVVDRLLNNFVEGSLGGKREGSQQAEQFLVQQISEYGQRLSAAEQRIAEFKRRNVGLVPGQQGDYFSRLQSENDALRQAKEKLNLEVRKQQALEAELHSGQPFAAGTTSSSGSSSTGAPLDTGTQIAQTQQRLDELLLKYTDQYPDVVQLRQTLKELQERQKAELEAAKRGDLSAATRLGLSANPVYQKLQEQYNQEQVDIASMQQDISDREKSIAELKSKMSSAPQVEAEYAQLTRDSEVTRTQYNDLLERLNRARLGQQADATGIVRFEVIDPPSAEFEPVAPNRPLLIGIALGLALAAGILAAYLLHLLRPVFVSIRQLAGVTGLPVLGAVSVAWLERFQTLQRRRRIFYVGASVALIAIGTGILLLQSQIYTAVKGLFA
jgi:polysaccharide chain length determinant protein (PEP-CTERM system associated)